LCAEGVILNEGRCGGGSGPGTGALGETILEARRGNYPHPLRGVTVGDWGHSGSQW